ncbi:MAG: valine--tRNA ligase, partial [Chloroflexi bacterium]|nr:valine--tRNA ligase [Chloroflexota bacterium]
RITNQIRRLGASCDWSRERFTLDAGLSKAVREAFVQLYEKGLIYRGPRLINWSPGLKTAVSDLEVEYHDEQGKLYYFKYRIADSPDDFIPVATTRPETILGDTAVAVHPEDARYQHFIGKKAIVPILGREIPVISDEYVDREFGTGALKITPGHDPNDYDIGIRHNLDIISVLDQDAKINQHGGPFKGQDRFECRENLWNAMKIEELVIKEETHLHQVPRSQRGGEIIEPMISTQWFVETKPLAQKALSAVKDGRITIIPEHFTKVYYNWMENIQDWCISRQLWWGHRIPVWYCADCSEVTVAREDPSACIHCASKNIEQDPDVLDTWFSSGLWPFSTLGWPDETPDLQYFYPTTMMETGYDILFFWVARMIMMGLEFTGVVPFNEIYLHGLIRDKNGKKMSKSYGNVIDPLTVMDELGTDALRFTLLVGSTPGKDTNLSVEKVAANRNFANKLWNGTRFVLHALETIHDQSADLQSTSTHPWTIADSWVWARLQKCIRDVERLFGNHQYGEAGRQIYDFFWGDFADWYVEIAKLQLADGGEGAYTTATTLVKVLDLSLRMLHPFIPFVTEELWQHLRAAVLDSPLATEAKDWPNALIIAPYPEIRQAENWEVSTIKQFELVQEIVRTIRNLRAEQNVKPGQRLPAIFVSKTKAGILKSQVKIIASLAKLNASQITISTNLEEKPEGHVALVVGPVEVYLPLAKMVDPIEQRARLEKELITAKSQIQRLEKLLGSSFAQKAPEQVVAAEREKLISFNETATKLEEQIANLT